MAGADMFSVQGVPNLLFPRRRLLVRAAENATLTKLNFKFLRIPIVFDAPRRIQPAL